MVRLLKLQDHENFVSSDRLYYRIGEVSRITGLKPHVLRYWESEFKVIKPYKAGSLQRLYRKKDLEIIQKIKISGFGNFVVRRKRARRGRNPQTGDDIEIGARRILTFKPSQVLKGGLNEGEPIPEVKQE